MVKVDFIGLNDFTNRIKNASKEVQAKVANEVTSAAFEFESGAIKNLIGHGNSSNSQLVKSIGKIQETPFEWKVFAGAYYAPFIEFGTKGQYSNPLGVDVPAYTKRGNFSQMLASIEKWVKKKGIAGKKNINQVAFAISVSILKNGITPKPFFYKNITTVKANLIKRIEAALNGL